MASQLMPLIRRARVDCDRRQASNELRLLLACGWQRLAAPPLTAAHPRHGHQRHEWQRKVCTAASRIEHTTACSCQQSLVWLQETSPQTRIGHAMQETLHEVNNIELQHTRLREGSQCSQDTRDASTVKSAPQHRHKLGMPCRAFDRVVRVNLLAAGAQRHTQRGQQAPQRVHSALA